MLHFEGFHLFGRLSVQLKIKLQLESILSSQRQVNFCLEQQTKVLLNFLLLWIALQIQKKVGALSSAELFLTK